MDDQHKLSLPQFRSQINHILMTEKKTDFVGYMNELHKVGEAAYKRSSIPNENMIEAAQELKGIKRVCTVFVIRGAPSPVDLKSSITNFHLFSK